MKSMPTRLCSGEPGPEIEALRQFWTAFEESGDPGAGDLEAIYRLRDETTCCLLEDDVFGATCATAKAMCMIAGEK